MKIPEKIRVEGVTYKVFKLSDEEMASLYDGEGSVCGITVFTDCKILINNSYCREMQEQTFIHELMHIVDSRIDPLTEEQIDTMARRMYSVFKDNKIIN